ncbi:MAG: NADH-quinone oxidoreductase subunit M [Acidimicrobiia bacterium]|nr:NADH-quinone oxidoreductase subunit M [Acidimicrobiia bacterium]
MEHSIGFPVIALLVLLPTVGAVVIAMLPKDRSELLMPITAAISVLPLAVSLFILWEFSVADGAEFQFAESVNWYEAWGIGWNVGIDGISLLLIVLTTFLFPISIVASAYIKKDVKLYMISMLLLETGLIGVFVSLDLLLFFVFFEMTLIPMYFLIGIWGSENRVYAAVKFFLYTAFGSALLLTAIIALAILNGNAADNSISFNYAELSELALSSTAQMWLFLGFGAAFAIKVPLFPFHTWLPDAHTEAPTAGSVILAGVLLKLGTYGFVRFNLTLFPEATVTLAPWLGGLAVVGIIYGAAVAIVQPDVKRLVAYSSVSHLGFIVLGTFALTSQGLQGGIIQMVNHGLTTGALFLLIGMIYERRHTRQISEYGGLSSVMPLFAGVFLFMAFASIGLPGLNGFIGEFKILLGSWLAWPVLAILAASGVVLAAIYLLWAYERMFTGPVTNEANKGLKDLNGREIAILAPIAVMILFLGLYPKPALDRIEPAVESIIDRIEQVTDYEAPEFGRIGDVEEVAGEGP